MSKTWAQKGEEMEIMSCNPQKMFLGWLSLELILSKHSKLLRSLKRKKRRRS